MFTALPPKADIRSAVNSHSLVQWPPLRNFSDQLGCSRIKTCLLLFFGQMVLRVLTAARCELVAFLSHFCANHERTSVNPGLSHVSESQSTSGLSIDSEMYSFTSGTIVSACTSSPSMPGTQPVSSNISLAVSRRALTSLVVALLMIGFLVLVH